MYATPIPNKEATTVAKSFMETLKRQRKEYPKAPIKTLLSDDGGEFKGAFEELLTREKITKKEFLAVIRSKMVWWNAQMENLR